MIFLYPAYLWGLLAVAIPVIIHLFRFRRYKTVYFSNITVLKAVKSETKKQSQLKHLLVLITRILAIIMLVLAFARPVIPEQKKTTMTDGKSYVTVYLDNSLSMQVTGDQGQLFSEAINKAMGIAQAYTAADRFRLITNEFNPARQRFTDRDSFLDQIERVTISPVSRMFSEVKQRIAHNKDDIPVTKQEVYIISDFQKSTFDIQELEADSSLNWTWAPLKGVNPSNLFIDSCWITSPTMPLMQTSTLKASIRNSGQQSLQKIPLKLSIDGVQRALASFSIPADGRAEVTLSFTNEKAGDHTAVLEVNDNPITFDNRFYLSYLIRDKIKVLEIYNDKPSTSLRRLFGSDSLITFAEQEFRRINYSSLGDHQLIILNGLPAVSSGLAEQMRDLMGEVDFLIIPSGEHLAANKQLARIFQTATFQPADSGSYEVMSLANEHPLLENVFYQKIKASGNKNFDLPAVKRYFPLQAGIAADVIMRLSNGDPFMIYEDVEGSNVYTLSAPLDGAWSDFDRHPLFVPVVHRMAIVSQKMPPLYYMAGDKRTITIDYLPTGDQVLRMKNLRNGVESVPEIYRQKGKLEVLPHVSKPGHYQLLHDTTLIRTLSFNTDPVESELSTYNTDQLSDLLTRHFPGSQLVEQTEGVSFDKSLKRKTESRSLWRWFVWLALAFLATEVLLLRFYDRVFSVK